MASARRFAVAALALGTAACGGIPRTTPRFGSLEPFETRTFHLEHDVQLFSAKNGLKVALIPDPRTNLVSVDVRYLVGAAEDPPDRAGMAHLVEHLMFELRQEAGGPTLGDELGDVALFYNAWTNWDETHYTATALAGRLPELLELEARRLEAGCDQLDDAVFVRERDVVLEEQAQREGDLAELEAELATEIWGGNHPYGRAVGSREIAGATRAEACDFIAAHYAPDRAILVVSGALDLEATTALIGKRFGPMARRSTGRRVDIAAPQLSGSTSEHVADIDEATALVFFPRPPWGSDDEIVHRFASALLGVALAREDAEASWITDTSVDESGGYRQSTTVARISVADPARLDDAVALVHAQAKELAGADAEAILPTIRGRVRAAYAAAADAYDGRGAWIADYLQYTSGNYLMLDDLGAIDLVTIETLATYVMFTFTREHSHVALVTPSGAPSRAVRATVASSARDYDLAPWRAPVDAAEAARPLEVATTRVAARVSGFTLDNGLHVLLAPDAASPVVDARLVFPVGTIADPEDQRGVAVAAAALLDHDYQTAIPLEDLRRVEWAMQLGSLLSSEVDERTTTFGVQGLGVFADWHLWRLSWLLDLGVYADADIEAARERAADAIDDVLDAGTLALRVKLYGADHPYAAPASDVADLRRIGKKQLTAFKRAHYRARGATLIVAGGFDPAAMKAEVTELFGAWTGDAPAELPQLPEARPATGPSFLAVHDAGATQARVTVAFATRSSAQDDRAARLILRLMVEDRVRQVREGLGASYGLSVGYVGGAGGGALVVAGDVDPQRAAEALRLVVEELAALRDQAADLAEDFVRARRRALALMLADSAGASDLAGELEVLTVAGLGLDAYDALARQIGATTPADVAAVAAADLAAARMVVMVSGRAEVVDPALGAIAEDATIEQLDPE